MAEYIEFKPGEKYPPKGADVADSPDHFEDAGYVIQEDELIIDIDDVDKGTLKKMIDKFNIKTHTVWTERGVHFYFKKPSGFRASDQTCPLGFKLEYKYRKKEAPVYITVKREGILRKVDNENHREALPDIFKPDKKKHEELLGLSEGDGRNNKLFNLRRRIQHMSNWHMILEFVNEHVFDEPLDKKEMEAIVRDMAIDDGDDALFEYDVATELMQRLNMVNYMDMIYQYDGFRHVNDANMLQQEIFETVGKVKTRVVHEIMEQIKMRAPVMDQVEDFPIKFLNGILKKGEFLEIDYKDFTPFTIPIEYKPDAEPVKIVDDYLHKLVDGDDDYKNLLKEVLGHTLVTDKEMKRLLSKFFIFVGDGGNGKGTLLAIIREILQSENCTALSIKNMSDERYFTTMQGRLANLGDDIQDEAINNEQMKQLKNISTCDFVATRELFKQSRSVELTVSLIFTSNHQLKSFEKGHSYQRRVLWLPMYSKPTTKSNTFITDITSEKALEYWLRLMLEGYFRLYENQTFTESDKVKEFNKQYHDENNTAVMYLRDLTVDDLKGMKPPQAHEAYEAWAEENGLNVQSMKLFRESVLEVHGLKVGAKKMNGKTARVFMYPDETKQRLA